MIEDLALNLSRTRESGMSATLDGLRARAPALRAPARTVRPRIVRREDPASGRDVHEELAQLLHEGALEPKRWRDMLELLGRELKGNSADADSAFPPPAARLVCFTAWGGSPEVLSPQYSHRYFAMDPFVQLPEKQVITLHGSPCRPRSSSGARSIPTTSSSGTRSTTSASTCARKVATTRGCA